MKILTLLLFFKFTLISWSQNPLPDNKRTNGSSVRQVLEAKVSQHYKSLVKILHKQDFICSGVIIEHNGFILSKRSELPPENINISLHDGAIYQATLIGTDKKTDLALLKINKKGLSPLIFPKDTNLKIGDWLITATPQKRAKIGVKSARSRDIVKISGVMGILLGPEKNNGIEVSQSINAGPAHAAGIHSGDIILKIDSTEIKSKNDILKSLKNIGPGQTISLRLLRASKTLSKTITLGDRNITFGMFNRNLEMSGTVSKRLDSFPNIIQHDTPLTHREMTTPIFNLTGKIIGLNIAKANRAEFFALTNNEVKAAIERLQKIDVSLEKLIEQSQTTSFQQFLDLQNKLKKLLPSSQAATVGILANGASGSGVIVSEDGYILTAAHISSTPGNYIRVSMPDGTLYEAESLGRHPKADLGLIKITEKNIPKLKFAVMASSTKENKANWCYALGHPNGFNAERGAVLRIGRIIDIQPHLLWTDCTLLGGDSGGPLFNFKGEVIGIHSRIFDSSEDNIHGPVDLYLKYWEKFKQAKTISEEKESAFLGITTNSNGIGVKVLEVIKKSAADRAGIATGDIILSIDQKPIISTEELIKTLKGKKVGQAVKIILNRQGIERQITATLGLKIK